jgi:hypothetical protein
MSFLTIVSVHKSYFPSNGSKVDSFQIVPKEVLMHLTFLFFFFFNLVVLGMELRALRMLGKNSTMSYCCSLEAFFFLFFSFLFFFFFCGTGV